MVSPNGFMLLSLFFIIFTALLVSAGVLALYELLYEVKKMNDAPDLDKHKPVKGFIIVWLSVLVCSVGLCWLVLSIN